MTPSEEKPRYIVWFNQNGVIELVCPVHGKVTRIKSDKSPLNDDECMLCVLDNAKDEPRHRTSSEG